MSWGATTPHSKTNTSLQNPPRDTQDYCWLSPLLLHDMMDHTHWYTVAVLLEFIIIGLLLRTYFSYSCTFIYMHVLWHKILTYFIIFVSRCKKKKKHKNEAWKYIRTWFTNQPWFFCFPLPSLDIIHAIILGRYRKTASVSGLGRHFVHLPSSAGPRPAFGPLMAVAMATVC